MTSELVKKQLEELTARIEKTELNIGKLNDQLEQAKSDKLQLIGAYQMATSFYQTLKTEEEQEIPVEENSKPTDSKPQK